MLLARRWRAHLLLVRVVFLQELQMYALELYRLAVSARLYLTRSSPSPFLPCVSLLLLLLLRIVGGWVDACFFSKPLLCVLADSGDEARQRSLRGDRRALQQSQPARPPRPSRASPNAGELS